MYASLCSSMSCVTTTEVTCRRRWRSLISSLIVVSGIWRFYRDEYYKGDHWDLGPGFYECFFTEAGPDDSVSSFQAISLT